MKLSQEFVKYMLVGQVIVPFFINIAVNVVIGTLVYWGQSSVTTWTWNKGAAADSIGTCFFLPFITCLIATPIVRLQSKNGTAPRVSHLEVPRWTKLMSRRSLIRAAQCGIIGILFLAASVYAAYCALAPESIETVRFITMKALFAGAMGILATPLIAFVAMCDEPALSRDS